MNISRGFEKHGLPVGKRDLREPKKNLESTTFKDPLGLVISIVKLIYTIFLETIRGIYRIFTAKPKSLKGKVCFVTGSGRGLGREICKALAREGAIIACADINEENNKKTLEILTELGAKAKAYKLNVANKSQVEELANRVESDLGRVYLLVNNAAIVMPHPEPDEDYVRATFGVNVLGAIWTIGAFLHKMKDWNDGHIVNVSSMGAVTIGPVLGTYFATKAALSSYSMSLEYQLILEGCNNIHVTTVHPWIMNTSEDYVDSASCRINAAEAEDVATLVINAIKYNKSGVSTNPFYYFLLTFIRFLPKAIVLCLLEVFNLEATIPEPKEFRDLSITDIIKETNSTLGDANGDSMIIRKND